MSFPRSFVARMMPRQLRYQVARCRCSPSTAHGLRRWHKCVTHQQRPQLLRNTRLKSLEKRTASCYWTDRIDHTNWSPNRILYRLRQEQNTCARHPLRCRCQWWPNWKYWLARWHSIHHYFPVALCRPCPSSAWLCRPIGHKRAVRLQSHLLPTGRLRADPG